MDKKKVIESFKRRGQAKLKSSVRIYERAKWHFESVQEAGLPQLQAYVHGGLLFAWLVDKKLLANEPDLLGAWSEQLACRAITPVELFQTLDGILDPRDLNDEANAFLQSYFDQYTEDFRKTLLADHSNEFMIEGSWDNFDTLRNVLDSRFENWRESVRLHKAN